MPAITVDDVQSLPRITVPDHPLAPTNEVAATTDSPLD